MSYYAKNPHDQPEPPRCIECDDCMAEAKPDYFGAMTWECRNPECEACKPEYKTRVPADRYCPACRSLLETNSVYCDNCGTDTPKS